MPKIMNTSGNPFLIGENMNDWPLGLSTGCFYQRSIFDCLNSVASSGFRQSEVCSSPAHLDYHDRPAVRRAAEKLRKLALEGHSFHAPFAEHIDITSPDARKRANSIGEVFAAAETAAELGARFFVIHPGPEHAAHPLGMEWSERLENVVDALEMISDRCRKLGTICVLENKLPHLIFGNLPDIMWILEAIESPNIGVCLDTGHAHLAGDLWNVARSLAPYLRMIHASDNRGRMDDHLPPEEGEIDWARLFVELAAHGFQGSIILEIAGRGGIPEILHSATRACSYLKGQAAAARREQSRNSQSNEAMGEAPPVFTRAFPGDREAPRPEH